MASKKKLAIIVLAAVVVLAAAYAAYRLTYAQPAPAYVTTSIAANASQNSSATNLVNSSAASNFNGTSENLTALNQTVNANVTQDQNQSVLSTGNIIPPP